MVKQHQQPLINLQTVSSSTQNLLANIYNLTPLT